MSVRCVSSSGRSLSRILFASLFSISLTSGVAFADSAGTGGGTENSASSAGGKQSKASQNADTTSVASTHGKRAGAGTVTEGTARASGKGRHQASGAGVSTMAYAKARTLKGGVQAEAGAAVAVTATAMSSNGLTTANLNSVGVAGAYSIKGRMGAFAYADTQTYAYAASGHRGGLTVSVPGGSMATYGKGRTQYAIAYTNTGTFSIAIQTRKSVSAMTGTTGNATALATGDLRALASSGVFASAYADRRMASAFASAYGLGQASTAGSFARAEGFSSAYAVAIRTGNAKVAVDGDRVCVSIEFKPGKKKRECRLLRTHAGLKHIKTNKQAARVSGNWNSGLPN